MRTPSRSFLLSLIAIAAIAKTARGADERLLVVVESAPGVGVDARDVRQTIGAELGISVVAPTDATAAAASNVLIVSVDRADIRMSLRGSAAGLVARTIPAPLDRPARLRRIGWLAGNLARDQVSGIVAAPAERGPATREMEIAAADVTPATAPTPDGPAPDDLLPPPAPSAAANSAEPAAIVSARPAKVATSQGPHWAITAASGATGAAFSQDGSATAIREVGHQLELQHQSSPDALIFGAALDVGTRSPLSGADLVGIAGFVGTGWRHRRWFVETTAGLGLEVARLPNSSLHVPTIPPNGGPISETTVNGPFQSLLYLRGVATAGLSITTSLDLVGRVGVHLASAGGFAADLLSASAGLRFTLP